MNKKNVILLLTIVHWSIVHAQFSENFSDSDLSANPPWGGDVTRFIVENDQLRLLAPAVQESSYLSTASQAIINAKWEVYVKLNFNPSASNLVRIYLTSDQQDLGNALNGYYVQAGGTEDDVSLYRQSGNTRTKIIDGPDGILSNSENALTIRVTTDNNGTWELYTDVGATGTPNKVGEITDTEHPMTMYSGIYCLYTSTRSDKFYFDDFVVEGIPFIPEPTVSRKAVIFTEIYPNPSPTGLPAAEFVEIYNRTDRDINLTGWQLADAQTAGKVNGVIAAHGYGILIASASVDDFKKYGNVIAVAGFPALNNSGDVLVLSDRRGFVIDSVNYTDNWYGDADKKTGGWTLELIDPENPCGEDDNWTASEAPEGGTPGSQNSVFANKPDVKAPELVEAIPVNPTTLILTFSEKLENEIPALQNFSIIPEINVNQIRFFNPALTQLEVQFGAPIQKSVEYAIRVTAIRDCNGNISEVFEKIFALPEEPVPGDVVINEILFNPWPTGVDFVELYNPTTRYFNLRGWYLGNGTDDTPGGTQKITADNLLLPPDGYLVVTTNAEGIISHYPQAIREHLAEAWLPSLPDDEGSIAVIDSTDRIIDQFRYRKELHSVFIKDEEGVSLERIYADSPSENPENWKSAAAAAGFATPGFLNSNSLPENHLPRGEVSVDPEIFIPVTGQPDFTEIHYQFEQGGMVANVRILNARGVVVKQLAENTTLGIEGFFRWDGDLADGSKGRIGYYVVWFQVFGTDGNVKNHLRRVVIAAQF